MKNPSHSTTSGGAKSTSGRASHSSRVLTLQELARALRGEIVGGEVLAPGPGHSAKDRSLSAKPTPDAPDGFVVHSFAGDDWRACRELVSAALGLPKDSRHDIHGQGPCGSRHEPPQARNAARKHCALSMWTESSDPRGSLVEIYLAGRGIELPDEAAAETIRFHSACPFGAERFPAMVCLVRNIRTNLPQAVHRTALSSDGFAIKRSGKAFRLSLGPIKGGAIKLDADKDVTMGLCIGEGLETCLAGRQMGLRPVWSVLSTAGIASFPILPGIESLHVLRENDPNLAGPKSVEDCAARWRRTGREVIMADPTEGLDLNDELRGAAA
jgi:putative DNA primase/helicase